ncbi:DUF4304 domain-containing protein [Microbacterium sp. SORGH_AS_0862]|uniref:DUF4304 domain-containing protein n=1 Tax=Microbacterium sp. SORGH_AS_0862 TaxID=3041789 RepID=UPI002791F46D|nr:DUF4304 domain-containing protein [Microbacterium sp. SORGH_AS_0862]MDQ1206593.1 hypothetical protein [Microbacterium sp. SORGH_AS_0862]
MELEARLVALVAEAVVPVLKPRGYRKKRLTWMRETPDAAHEIVLQRSHGNGGDHLRIYIEGAAYVPAFDEAIGKSVPASMTAGTPQYRQRFESIADWPAQWIDLETWSHDALVPQLREAMEILADHLDAIRSADELAAAKLAVSTGLDVDLFAWWCVTGNEAERTAQYRQALATFGQEERWPRLRAQFATVASRHGLSLPD